MLRLRFRCPAGFSRTGEAIPLRRTASIPSYPVPALPMPENRTETGTKQEKNRCNFLFFSCFSWAGIFINQRVSNPPQPVFLESPYQGRRSNPHCPIEERSSVP